MTNWKRIRLSTLVALVWALVAAVAAGQEATGRTIRVFRLAHREPAEALLVVQPLLSENGTVSVMPRLRTLSVQDRPENLVAIEQAIRELDVPPRLFRVKLSFYRASETVTPAAPGPVRLRGVGQRMADMLRYTNYDPLDEIVVTSEEGGKVEARVGDSYHVDFRLEGDASSAQRLRLRSFGLDRIRRDDQGGEQLMHVFRTSVNLTLEQPFVLGATRDEKSRTALLIVLLAQPVEAGKP